MRLIALLAVAFSASIQAHTSTFVVDPERSFVTLSGTVAGSEIREQGPMSLTTTGTGTLEVEIEGSTIQIVSGSITAQNNGSWAPAEEGAQGTARRTSAPRQLFSLESS